MTWETREAWPNRMVYVALRDAHELEKLMSVCPAWGAACESIYFATSALTDPVQCLLISFGTTPSP